MGSVLDIGATRHRKFIYATRSRVDKLADLKLDADTIRSDWVKVKLSIQNDRRSPTLKHTTKDEEN